MSGIEDMRIAIAFWAIAGVWGLIALFTWEPVFRVLRSIKRIRIVIANSNGAKPKREDVGGVGEKGLLDHRVAVLKVLPKMYEIFIKYTKDTETLTKKIESHARNSQKTTDAIKLQKIASKSSNDIENYSKKTEEFLSEYTHLNITLDDSFIPQIKMEDHKEIRQSIPALLKTTQQTQQTIQFFRNKTLELGHISQDLYRASRRLANLLEGFINELKHTESFCKKVLASFE